VAFVGTAYILPSYVGGRVFVSKVSFSDSKVRYYRSQKTTRSRKFGEKVPFLLVTLRMVHGCLLFFEKSTNLMYAPGLGGLYQLVFNIKSGQKPLLSSRPPAALPGERAFGF